MTHLTDPVKSPADSNAQAQIFHGLPRVLCILAILFISMFAMDSFDPALSLGKQITGFLIHLIPSYILTALLLIAWKSEKVGGIIFILIGVIFTPIVFLQNYNMNQSIGMSLLINLMITMPFVLVGVLFLMSHRIKRRAGN